MTPARKKASITIERISALDKAPLYAVQHMNLPYGVLVGDRADNGSIKARMRWKLILAPKMTEHKNWPVEKVMSLAGARKYVENLANVDAELVEKGILVAVKYITKFGFEMYLDHNNQMTYDLAEAKFFTYNEASAIIQQATPFSPACEIEGDLIQFAMSEDKFGFNQDQMKNWVLLRHLEQLKRAKDAAQAA